MIEQILTTDRESLKQIIQSKFKRDYEGYKIEVFYRSELFGRNKDPHKWQLYNQYKENHSHHVIVIDEPQADSLKSIHPSAGMISCRMEVITPNIIDPSIELVYDENGFCQNSNRICFSEDFAKTFYVMITDTNIFFTFEQDKVYPYNTTSSFDSEMVRMPKNPLNINLEHTVYDDIVLEFMLSIKDLRRDYTKFLNEYESLLEERFRDAVKKQTCEIKEKFSDNFRDPKKTDFLEGNRLDSSARLFGVESLTDGEIKDLVQEKFDRDYPEFELRVFLESEIDQNPQIKSIVENYRSQNLPMIIIQDGQKIKNIANTEFGNIIIPLSISGEILNEFGLRDFSVDHKRDLSFEWAAYTNENNYTLGISNNNIRLLDTNDDRMYPIGKSVLLQQATGKHILNFNFEDLVKDDLVLSNMLCKGRSLMSRRNLDKQNEYLIESLAYAFHERRVALNKKYKQLFDLLNFDRKIDNDNKGDGAANGPRF